MKICWDNLEKLKYRSDRGEWQDESHFYIYNDFCKICGEPFLARKDSKGEFCGNYRGEYHPNYGKKHSEETRKKMSENHKDISGINNPFYGKHHTEESLEKMSGERNPGWKGGISCEPYCDVWLDKEFKESIKERDGYQCLNPSCSKESKRLCVHHINYIKKDCRPFNLITLCNSCNIKANFDREWHQSWYQILMYRREK